MKILSSPTFNKKITNLDTNTLLVLEKLLSQVKAGSINSPELIVADNVYAVRNDGITLYYTKNDKDDSIILLDVIPLEGISQKTNRFRNSSLNDNSLNPMKNRSINPNFNRDLNPIFNRSINPIFNRSLNPIFNRSINPIFNRSINPIFNRSLNPIFNRSINPIFNRSLNPIFNKSFEGPYLYSLDSKVEGFIVSVGENISVVFDNHPNKIGMLAPINDEMKIYYDDAGKHRGYFLKASEKVWLHFDVSMKWVGFLV